MYRAGENRGKIARRVPGAYPRSRAKFARAKPTGNDIRRRRGIATRIRHEPKMAEATQAVKEGRRKGEWLGAEEGRGKRDVEKRSCDQESQLPTLAQVHPVEHIFPT